jgi:hypothetical protein
MRVLPVAALCLNCSQGASATSIAMPTPTSTATATATATSIATPTSTATAKSSAIPTSDADAFQSAFRCAKEQFKGLGLWDSPLRFSGVPPQHTERGWVFAFPETEPKGKPQGLSLLIDKTGHCTRMPTE